MVNWEKRKTVPVRHIREVDSDENVSTDIDTHEYCPNKEEADGKVRIIYGFVGFNDRKQLRHYKHGPTLPGEDPIGNDGLTIEEAKNRGYIKFMRCNCNKFNE